MNDDTIDFLPKKKGSGVFIPTNSVNTPPVTFVLVLVILALKVVLS